MIRFLNNKGGIDTSDANAVASNILLNKTAYANGTKLVGTMPNNETLNYIPSTSQQTIPAGYTDGGSVGAVTSSIDSNIVATNIKKDVSILGVTGTYEGEGGNNNALVNTVITSGSDITNKNIIELPYLDISGITSLSTAFKDCSKLTTVSLSSTANITNMQSMFNGCSALTSVPNLDTSSVTNMNQMFRSCRSLTSIPTLNTSNVSDFSSMFYSCTGLTTVPVLDFSAATNLNKMFNACSNLSNDSLNNIMSSCLTASNYAGTKTLQELGLTATQATTCQGLSNYQSFVAAGWSTGY